MNCMQLGAIFFFGKPFRFVAVGIAVAVLAACRNPVPPTIIPEKVEVVSVSTTGVNVQLTLRVTNPNPDEIAARSVNAKIIMEGLEPMGTVTIAEQVRLPANAETNMTVPLSASWGGITTLLRLAAQKPTIPYDVEGTVNVGGNHLNIDIPFRAHGTVTRETLTDVMLRSIPQP